MRVAIVSDMHGNLTALDAVISDLGKVSPDLIVFGGDLLGAGARPAEVVDQIRGFDWPCVYGNADEMLWNPDRAADHLKAPELQRVREIVLRHISVTVDAIEDERLAWLRALPMRWTQNDLTVVHASPEDGWRSPAADASDEDLVNTYSVLGSRRVVYGHIHRPFVRRLPTLTIVNSGSVSLSYDGDPRSAYVLLDDDQVTIRRVEYDIEREVKMLFEAQYPFAAWIADMLRKGAPVPPPPG